MVCSVYAFSTRRAVHLFLAFLSFIFDYFLNIPIPFLFLATCRMLTRRIIAIYALYMAILCVQDTMFGLALLLLCTVLTVSAQNLPLPELKYPYDGHEPVISEHA